MNDLTNDVLTNDATNEAVLETGFTLAFCDKVRRFSLVCSTAFDIPYWQVLHHILLLFPPLSPKARHIHTLTRIHVILSLPSLTIPFLTGLVEEGLKSNKHQLVVTYQIAFC